MRIIKSLGASLVTFYFIGVFFSQLTFNPYSWFLFNHKYNIDVLSAMVVSFLFIIVLIMVFYKEVFNEKVD